MYDYIHDEFVSINFFLINIYLHIRNDKKLKNCIYYCIDKIKSDKGISLQDGQGFLDRQVKRKNVHIYKVGSCVAQNVLCSRKRIWLVIGANGTRLSARIYCAWTCFHLFFLLCSFSLFQTCVCVRSHAHDSVRYTELCKEKGEHEKRGSIGNGTGIRWRRGSSHLATHFSDSDSDGNSLWGVASRLYPLFFS